MKKKDKEIQKFMLKHPLKFVKLVRTTFPLLCLSCKLKLKRFNFHMQFKSYCSNCQKIIEEHYND